MIKAVLDTNILVSATMAEGNEFKLLELAREGKYELILSPGILEEFEGVISRTRFGFTENVIERIVDNISGIARIVEPKEKLDVVKEDPDDNKFLECALRGDADYIVSGDKHLRDLKEFREIKIVKSRRLIEILG